MKYFTYLLVLAALFAVPTLGMATAEFCNVIVNKPSDAEIAKTKNKLDEVFASNFRNKEIYKCAYCKDNVVRLYAAFKKQIPELKPEDISVLVIASDLWFTSNTVKDYHATKVKRARVMYEPKHLTTSINYYYHVVLEYNGRIYDLDYTSQPRPVSKLEYLRDNLYTEEELKLWHEHKKDNGRPISDLKVLIPPSAEYLVNTELHRRGRRFLKILVYDNKDSIYSLRDYFLKP